MRSPLDRAIQAQRAGRLQEAEQIYRAILRTQPGNSDALHLLGVLAGQAGRPDEAEALIGKAIAVQEHPVFLSNLASIQRQAGRLDAAQESLERALRLPGAPPELKRSLANLITTRASAESGNDAAAAESGYRRALAVQPDHGRALQQLARLLTATGRMAEAVALWQQAVQQQPDNAEAQVLLGIALASCKRGPQAEAAYRRAIELDPGHAGARNNYGISLLDAARLEEAEASIRAALELAPALVDAWINLGLVLRTQGRFAPAEAAYRQALALEPDSASAQMNLAMLLLMLGRFDEGWPLYQARYSPRRGYKMARSPQPQWRGEPLAGKSLLVRPEQGLGDCIQFVRYAPLLKQAGLARLTVACAPPLIPLLATARGIDAVVPGSAPAPPHDYWCMLMDLPLRFATTPATIPARVPYLRVLPQRSASWRPRLPAGRKAGLVWRGNADHKNDAHRSLPGLATLAPLWAVPGWHWVSLQKGSGEDEARQAPSGQPLTALGAQIEDFADSAAIVAELDLVICVDTAIAHLAGALGKPAWVLLPTVGLDWRWMAGRSDSPWYPTLRLFRQSAAGDWQPAIAQVAAALAAWPH